jgi:hypothetical protein
VVTELQLTEIEPAFIDDTAKKLRKHRATVAREVARATKISALADVPGTALDKADELDALAKLPAPCAADPDAASKTSRATRFVLQRTLTVSGWAFS